MSCETQSLHVFCFKKTLERFSILFTYSSYSLQICIKPCCMYLSCQLLFKTPHKIPTKIAAVADKENIGKHDRMEVFSTEKNSCLSTMYKLCLYSQKEVRNVFSSNLETWISKIFPLLSILGIPHGDCELVNCKETESLGENHCR